MNEESGFHSAFILLGSNLGDSASILIDALTQIELLCGEILSLSSVYETAAWGVENQQNYLNQVVEIYTELPPHILLDILLDIENKFGRKRIEKWGARTLDLDILFYENQIIETPKLIVPHPRLHLRNFTLVPLNEIAANFIHPLLEKSISDILRSCPDKLAVKKMPKL